MYSYMVISIVINLNGHAYIMVRPDLHFVPVTRLFSKLMILKQIILILQCWPFQGRRKVFHIGAVRLSEGVCVCVCMCVCVEPDLTCNEGILRYVQLFFNQINCMSLIWWHYKKQSKIVLSVYLFTFADDIKCQF